MAEFTQILTKYSDLIPVPVFKIIEDLGIGLQFKPLDDEISGWIEKTADDRYNIVINEKHPLTRRRFTAAHELGHFLYHRDILGAGTGDTRAYRAERTPFANESIRPRHERQANTFAANLLMPVDKISNLRGKGISDVGELAEQFEVSREAMRIRTGA